MWFKLHAFPEVITYELSLIKQLYIYTLVFQLGTGFLDIQCSLAYIILQYNLNNISL